MTSGRGMMVVKSARDRAQKNSAAVEVCRGPDRISVTASLARRQTRV